MRPRQDRMTPAERMRALLGGQPIDRVPLFLAARGFCARNVGYPISAMYSDPEKSFWAKVWTQEQYGYDGYPVYSAYICFGAWEFGGEVDFPRGEYEQAPKVIRFPVNSEEDVDKLKVPDVKTAGAIPINMQFCKLQEKHGIRRTVGIGSPFNMAGGICGMERLGRWMIKKPELVHRILRKVTDFCVQVVQYSVDTFGAENIELREASPLESNQVISPQQFEEFALPYTREVHEKVLAMGVKHIFSHICGEQNLNLPYLARIPFGDRAILSFGHEVDLATAIKYFGDTSIIAGNVEPAVIQSGTPQQVYELSKQAIEKAKYAPRGFILMPGCELPPMAPPYNVYMMKKAINDFGWYE